MFLEIFKLLRIHQYIKNLFIFAPLFFTFSFTMDKFISVSIAFILFSIIASSIYVFNDLMDIEEDKKHPSKRFRPLASGKVSKQNAKILIISLSTISLISAYVLNIQLISIITKYKY